LDTVIEGLKAENEQARLAGMQVVADIMSGVQLLDLQTLINQVRENCIKTRCKITKLWLNMYWKLSYLV
jgi:hypothetical protein